jgi:hypothetical protein
MCIESWRARIGGFHGGRSLERQRPVSREDREERLKVSKPYRGQLHTRSICQSID